MYTSVLGGMPVFSYITIFIPIPRYGITNFACRNIDKFEFRETTKMLTVLTDNIIDQNHFRNIIRTSLSNSSKRFRQI